jgi:hypothetical protein
MTGNGGSATVSPVVSPPIPSGSNALGASNTTSSGINFSAASLSGMMSSNNNNLSGNLTGSPATSIAGGGSAAGLTDPVTGQLLADCDPARLAALSYPRLSAGGLGPMYTASYPSTDQNPYPSIAMENSFYGSLVSEDTIYYIIFRYLRFKMFYIFIIISINELKYFTAKHNIY